MIGEQIGNFRIVSQLGAGGMGEVFLGEHEKIGTKVAIKLLQLHISANHEHVQRFFNEAIAASKIQHAGIGKIFDVGHSASGRAYLVMEFLDGETLSARIKRLGRLPLAQVADIGKQITSVLEAVHKAGITHRDLKPDNIFIVSDSELGERVKVLDFGIAKLSSNSGLTATASGSMGTPAYMSPEQWKNSKSVDWRADAYSLGCVAFEMATGRPPFLAETIGEACAKHLTEVPPRASSLVALPQPLDNLLASLLSKDPAQRPPSMRDIGNAFAAVAAMQTPVSYASTQQSSPAIMPPPVHAQVAATMPSELQLNPPQMHAPTMPTGQPMHAPPMHAPPMQAPPMQAAPSMSPSMTRSTLSAAAAQQQPSPPAKSNALMIGLIAAFAGVAAIGVILVVVLGGRGNDDPAKPPEAVARQPDNARQIADEREKFLVFKKQLEDSDERLARAIAIRDNSPKGPERRRARAELQKARDDRSELRRLLKESRARLVELGADAPPALPQEPLATVEAPDVAEADPPPDQTPSAPPKPSDPSKPPDPVAAPQNVPPTLLEGQRIVGSKHIVPSDVTKTEIQRSGKDKIVGSFKLCLTTGGTVASVTQLKSTGFPAYDAKIKTEMQQWRYRPYVVNGKAGPVCTAVTFIYSQPASNDHTAKNCDEVSCTLDPSLACCAKGFLTINAQPYCAVAIDGKAVGTTPLVKVSVAVGKHVVTCSDPQGRFKETRSIQVKSGQTVVVALRPDVSSESIAPGGDLPDALDRSMIQTGVATVKGRVSACGDKSSAKGTVKVKVTVSSLGTVSSVTVQESPDPALGSCVASVMRNARFPKTQNGGSFSYPFAFSAVRDDPF